jgi:hypothetical protein
MHNYKRKKLIGIIGGRRTEKSLLTEAEEAGRLIAQRGATLVCGGLSGVMEAASRGAKAEGGLTVGILPGTDRQEANPYVDIPIVTGLGEARNALIVRTADAVVAIRGGYGTLSEIGLALKMGRPVVGLDTWELHQRGRPVRAVVPASSPVQAVERALALAKGGTARREEHG